MSAAAKTNVVPLTEPDELKRIATELKEKHGLSEIHLLTGDSGAKIFVRAPRDGEWRRFRTQIQNERTKVDAGETLLRSCLLYPEAAAFDLMVGKKPGLVDIFAAAVVEIAGMSEKAEKKVF